MSQHLQLPDTPSKGVDEVVKALQSAHAHSLSGDVAQLSTGLTTGGAITSLPVTALVNPVTNGATITVASGSHAQAWTLSAAAAAGDTSIAVESQTPDFAYPSGSKITGGARAVSVARLRRHFGPRVLAADIETALGIAEGFDYVADDGSGNYYLTPDGQLYARKVPDRFLYVT